MPRTTLRRCFAALIFTFATLCTSAQATTDPSQAAAPRAVPLLHAADLLADAAILRSAYEQLHPGLYRYNTKAEMDAHFAALNTALGHDQSLQEAFVAFSLFAAKVRCGHTYTNFFNQPKAVVETLFKGRNRVPFYFRWIDRRLVVTEDFTPGHTLPRGTQILSIDGVAAPQILDRLLPLARADGSNDAKRIAYLGVNGDSIYEPFDIYFPMLFPQRAEGLSLETRSPGAPPRHLTVQPLTFEQRIAPIRAREAERNGGSSPLFKWKWLPDGSAYLQMPTWALYNSKWDWKLWLNQHLDELADRKPRAFIIDLRGNEGGNDVGDEVLKRLTSVPLSTTALRPLVRYRQTPAELNPYLDTWDPSFRNWGSAAVDLPSPWPTAPAVPYFALNRKGIDDAAGAIAPEGKPYRGQVFVIIDSGNSSATFQFAQRVQQNHLGKLVGQTTGGSQRGINGGGFFFLRLPHSGVELDLPLIGTFPATPQPDRGIDPDIPVAALPADIADGYDRALATIARRVAAQNPRGRAGR